MQYLNIINTDRSLISKTHFLGKCVLSASLGDLNSENYNNPKIKFFLANAKNK